VKGLEPQQRAKGPAPHEQVTPGPCGVLRTAEFDIARTTQKQHVGAEYAVFSDALTVPGIDLMKRGVSRWIASQAPALLVHVWQTLSTGHVRRSARVSGIAYAPCILFAIAQSTTGRGCATVKAQVRASPRV
jgi:hypothetical protein